MTHRYLLFDSGCALCTRLAEDIAQVSGGWLMARSLRDPDVQALLDTARPGWRWEPTLLEVQDGQPRVFTGVRMRARMAVGLGPRRAWRVAQVMQQALAPRFEHLPAPTARRRFLQRGATAAGLFLLGPRVVSASSNANAQDPEVEISVLSLEEAANLIKDARKDTSVKELTTWLGQTKNWQEKTLVPFTVKGKDIEVSAVAMVDAATTGIIVYGNIQGEAGTSTSAVAVVPVANGRDKLFRVTNNGVEEIQTNKLPDNRPEYKVLHTLRPTGSPGKVQAAATDCCTPCRNCSLSNLACALTFGCCLFGGVPCCGAGLGICFTAILQCSNATGCNCIGACA